MTDRSASEVRQTLEQQRASNAASAARAVEAIDNRNTQYKKDYKKDYRSYVDRIGPTIVVNGLGQALAMERAAAGLDANSPHRRLYDNIGTWLCRNEGGIYPGAQDALTAVIEGSQDEYLRAQTESLAWLQWHKSLCRALLPRDRDLHSGNGS